VDRKLSAEIQLMKKQKEERKLIIKQIRDPKKRRNQIVNNSQAMKRDEDGLSPLLPPDFNKT